MAYKSELKKRVTSGEIFGGLIIAIVSTAFWYFTWMNPELFNEKPVTESSGRTKSNFQIIMGLFYNKVTGSFAGLLALLMFGGLFFSLLELMKETKLEELLEDDIDESSTYHQVSTSFSNQLELSCGDEKIIIPENTIIDGQLILQTSDGPAGEREYDSSSFLSTEFTFKLGENIYRHSGFIEAANLWASNGTLVEKESSGFKAHTSKISTIIDTREDWSYQLPDGTKHTNRLKYSSCEFWVMIEKLLLKVKCRYYDQNPDSSGAMTIFYDLPIASILLNKDTKICYDEEGEPEEYLLFEGDLITIVRM